jgi:hypothetical protein
LNYCDLFDFAGVTSLELTVLLFLNIISILISLPRAPISMLTAKLGGQQTTQLMAPNWAALPLLVKATPTIPQRFDVNLDAQSASQPSVNLELDAHRGGHDRKLVHAVLGLSNSDSSPECMNRLGYFCKYGNLRLKPLCTHTAFC